MSIFKACHVLVMDLSPSMESKSPTFNTTRLDAAKMLAVQQLEAVLLPSRKTDECSIITMDCNGAFDVVEILDTPRPEWMRKLNDLKIPPLQKTSSSTSLSSRLGKIKDQIKTRTKELQYERIVFLYTDGSVALGDDEDKLRDQIEAMSRAKITVKVFGIDFGELNRPDELQQAEYLLRGTSVDVDANVIYATPRLIRPFIKQVRQVFKFTGKLSISPTCELHVKVVSGIAEKRPGSLKKRSLKAIERALAGSSSSSAAAAATVATTMEDVEPTSSSSGEIQAAVLSGLDYHIPHEHWNLLSDRPVGHITSVKMERNYLSTRGEKIPPEQRGKGFLYGNSIIPMHGDDQTLLQWHDEDPCLKILSFVPSKDIARKYVLKPADVVMANPLAPNSQLGFSALVIAMRDLGSCAIARYVQKKGQPGKTQSIPKLVALIPGEFPAGSPAEKSELLWMVRVATEEDVRDYTFESLLSERNLPSEKEFSLMRKWIQHMTIGPNDAAQTNAWSLDSTPNPHNWRFNDTIKKRALDPRSVVTVTVDTRMQDILTPDVDMLLRSGETLEQIKTAFPLRKRMKKINKAGKETGGGVDFWAGAASTTSTSTSLDFIPRAGGDGGDGLTGGSKSVRSVRAETALTDFAAMMEDGDEDTQQRAVSEMENIVRGILEENDDNMFTKAIECCVALRRAYKLELRTHVQRFNSFLIEMKKAMFAAAGTRSTPMMWKYIKEAKLTLVSDDENENSDFNAFDAKAFLDEDNVGVATQRAGAMVEEAEMELDAFGDMD